MRHRAKVAAEVEVFVEWDDDEIIERGLTDEFRLSFYTFDDRADVLAHLAYNAIVNGRRDGRMLDGWADTDELTLRMSIDTDSYFYDVQEIP